MSDALIDSGTRIVGSKVGRYDVLRQIGRGGMAVVYLARQPAPARYVALKQLCNFNAASEAAHRFLREAQFVGSLNHSNIVVVLEQFEHHGVPYIAMEYLPRGSLRPHVGRLALPQIAGILEGVLAGLAHAEQAGIIHRDLKPENLLVTDEGRVKITDFGIAKATVAAGMSTFATKEGTTVGTPVYMAPEQAVGTEGLGPWTDIYSVGIMAYELVVGHPPFRDESAPIILFRHVNDPVPPAHEVSPDVSPALSDWIARLLAKAPADRPQTASDAWNLLEDIIIDGLGPRWRRDARLTNQVSPTNHPRPLTPAPFDTTRGANYPRPVHEPPAPDSTEQEPDGAILPASLGGSRVPGPPEPTPPPGKSQETVGPFKESVAAEQNAAEDDGSERGNDVTTPGRGDFSTTWPGSQPGDDDSTQPPVPDYSRNGGGERLASPGSLMILAGTERSGIVEQPDAEPAATDRSTVSTSDEPVARSVVTEGPPSSIKEVQARRSTTEVTQPGPARRSARRDTVGDALPGSSPRLHRHVSALRSRAHTRRRAMLSMVALTITLVVAAVLAMHREKPKAATVTSAGLAVRYETPWRRTQRAPMGASVLRSPFFITTGRSTLAGGAIVPSAAIPGAVPPQMLASFGSPERQTSVRLAGHLTRRYDWLVADERLVLLILPTNSYDRGLICSARVSDRVSMGECLATASAADVSSLTMLAPGPDISLGRSLTRILSSTSEERLHFRVSAKTQLQARSAPARALAAMEQADVSTLMQLSTPQRYQPVVARIVTALRRESVGLSELASAAAAKNPRSYNASRADIEGASKLLSEAITATDVDGLALPVFATLDVPTAPVVSKPKPTPTAPPSSVSSTPSTGNSPSSAAQSSVTGPRTSASTGPSTGSAAPTPSQAPASGSAPSQPSNAPAPLTNGGSDFGPPSPSKLS